MTINSSSNPFPGYGDRVHAHSGQSPSLARPRGRFICGVAAGAAVVVAGSGVATATTVPDDGADGGPTVVAIAMTPEGCPAPAIEFPTGAFTFEVENVSAVGVTEFEVMQGARILGEKENLPPGFSGSFSLNLQPGIYTLYCPGAATERTEIEVTGEASEAAPTDVGGVLAEGAEGYLGYVRTQVDELAEATGALDAAIRSGDVEAAKLAYINARPFYERIEPVAESFMLGDVNLDEQIDLRADEVEPTELAGFHRIEYGLWIDGSADGLPEVSTQLVADIESLRGLVAELPGFQPAELANGAVGLLDEAAAGKITGEEERYSHIDIVDMVANVEGAEQAFAYLEPGLSMIDPELVDTIKERFAALEAALAELEDPNEPSGYTLYDQLAAEQTTVLSQALQAVAEPLSQVAAKIVGA